MSSIKSIVTMTCPRCRSGKLFKQPYNYQNAYKMHEKCPKCSANFEPEPGFYFGAMFISYIMTGWLFIVIGLILVFGLGWSVTATIITVGLLTLVIHNLAFRFSRSLWIHFFLKYDPGHTKKVTG